jgi:hypothetical protein
MNVAELVTTLNQQGVQLWVEEDKLKIKSPKGTLTPEIQADLVSHKAALLAFLNQTTDVSCSTPTQLSLRSIGRLIGGFFKPNKQRVSDRTNRLDTSAFSSFKTPVIDPLVMAKQLKVTFRPLPKRFNKQAVLQFREELQTKLQSYGIQIIPWEDSTREFSYSLPIPLIKKTIRTRVVKPEIHAVIDVQRPTNPIKGAIAEFFYRIYKRFSKQDIPAAKIVQLVGWAEDHAMQRLEDPTATQVILLTELDPHFTDSNVSYQRKIAIGVNTLASQFSEVVIGLSDDQISILNMNLSDSLFPRDQLDMFVFKSLIPKIYVSIAPLPMSQFEIGTYEPQQSEYAGQLIQLSQALAKTDLFPSGFRLGEVIRRPSHQDLVSSIVNGRTGVSYGFVAYAEPPQYVGDRELSEQDWVKLSPVDGFSSDEVRQNNVGRRYIKTTLNHQDIYKQIPDIWLVCSRSGADKTALNLERDVLRLGLKHHLCLQFPEGIDPADAEIRPSYDTYVMVAIALSAALYAPQLIESGAPMIHFHGYPSQHWFEPDEAYTGIDNPSVPCGTYESGVFNFLGIHCLADKFSSNLTLAALIEPDHGTNIITSNLDHLLARLETGIQQGQIELGGKHFTSLVPSSTREQLTYRN